jgi:hypothetical protein
MTYKQLLAKYIGWDGQTEPLRVLISDWARANGHNASHIISQLCDDGLAVIRGERTLD